jgi:cysteine desulfurase / selenocysteine lyase
MRQSIHPVYLDHAAMGLPSAATVAAVSRFMESLVNPNLTGTQRSLELFEAVERARRQAAALVNVDPSCVLLVENTSRGLGLVASSLPLAEGDNVLVDDLEFLSATVSWRAVSRQRRLEIRAVKTQGGRVLPQDFARAADNRTRVLMLSSVQEVTGFRCDLRAFGHLAEDLDALLIIDGIQEAGAMHVDLKETPVDAYCAGGSKWLRSPFGLGFLYVSPSLLSRLLPPAVGYLALAEPRSGWQEYLQSPERTPFDPLPELQDARKLSSGGMPNGLGALALEHAIGETCAFGTRDTSSRISRLRSLLVRELIQSDVDVRALDDLSMEDSCGSGIVCFGLKEGIAAEVKLLSELLKAKVQVSLRYTSGIGGIRASLHYDNTADDVQALLEVVLHAKSASRIAYSKQPLCSPQIKKEDLNAN